MAKPKFYYTNARFNKQVAYLAGPFHDVVGAESCIDNCLMLFEASGDPLAQHASYGVVEINKSVGFGKFNVELRAMGMMHVPLPETN